MAAGRHDVSSRRGLYTYSETEHGQHRNGSSVPKLTRGRDRHANGYHYLSETSKLGGAGDSSQRGGFSVCAKDQELDQLHGRSRLKDVDVYGSRVEDGEVAISKIVVRQVTLEKKRKFSPIEWDREEKKVKVSSKNGIVQYYPSTSPTSLPESISVVSDGSVQIDPVTADQPQRMETPSTKSPVESASGGSTVSECSPASSSSLSQGQCGGDGQEGEQMEDEEFVETRNILMSRWVSEGDYPTNTCVSDDEDIPKRMEMAHHRNFFEPRLDMQQMSSPECGEFLREDSEDYRSRSSESVEGLGSPVSGEEYSDNESDKNDDIVIDEKHNADAVISQLESHSEDDKDSNENQEDTVPKRSINMLQSSRSVFDYEKLNKINEGTYGIVYRARDKQTGNIVALKKIKMGIERDGGFPLSSLREINILLSFHHTSIVNVKEVVMGDLDSVFMVMEYMEHDLKGMMGVMKQPFTASEVKCLMLQLLEGVRYLHDNWVLHRDLKSSNLLLNNRGDLKICDFGLSRQYGSPLKPYTPVVVTMWYRAPELLLGSKEYSTAIDMWSVGCIMAEMLSKEPLFKGKSEVDQLDKIFRTLGTPNETIWPGLSRLPGSNSKFVKQPYNQLRKKFPAASFTGSPVLSESGFDLLSKLLTYNPEKRITADAALNHGWFREVPLPKCKDFMPNFPAQNTQDRCRNR